MRPVALARIAGLLVLTSCIAPVDSDQAVGPLSLSLVSGNNQSAPPGTELPNPIVARVEDSRGRTVSGQIVNFVVVSGGGSVFAGAAISGRDGIVQERWTIGASGPQKVEARAVDNATGAKLTFAIFDATVLDVQPPQVLAVSTVPSSVPVGVPFDLTALVTDAATGGSNIAGATFTLDGGSATAMLAQDGAFDSPIEAVRAAVPGFSSGGSHVFCVTGRDIQSNSSSPSCLTVVIAEDAIYVSPAGNDATGTGSPTAPLRTITAGLTVAASFAKPRVNVAAGTYPENIQLRSTISLYGGYDPATWTRDPATFVTTIGPGPSSTALAITGDLVVGVTIDGFTIRSGDASLEQESAYGILVTNSTVTISNNHIIAGNGGAGINGADGNPVPSGVAGEPGHPGGLGRSPGPGGLGGVVSCGPFLAGGTGGQGGDPGLPGQRGDAGSNVNSGPGGDGGVGGSSSPLPTGRDGFAGGPGFNGAAGVGGVDFTGMSFNGITFRYGPADGDGGRPGGHGGSGGGGGGGGGLNALFLIGGGNGGGGGGSGGCGGDGGRAGGGGGASLGIVGLLSTLTVTGNTIETGHGGVGGNGGSGTPGGTGAPGGAGATVDAPQVGAGGTGGTGGTGGAGGPGGAGGGGASIGILGQAARLTESGNTFVLGNGGVGGLAAPGGNPGANGRRVAVQSPP